MRSNFSAARIAWVVVCACHTACAGAVVVGPSPSLPQPRREALLILPGFGYNAAGERALRSLAASITRDGFDFFLPAYVSRSGLEKSRANLQRFILEQHLEQYDHLHVFAFIAGGWTFNPLMETQRLPNLATVIYDRSPFQERAPRIADEKLHVLTWIRYGSPVFDVARTPYVPLDVAGVNIALVVETTPTSFIRKHQATARGYGPFRFDCDAFLQRYQDCMYVPMNHDELYTRFAEVWPELLAFIRTSRFTSAAKRTPPAGDPFAGHP